MNSPDERVFQLRPPVGEARNPNDPAKPFIVMYHGSLVERHGLDLAVGALVQVRNSIPALELRVYGERTPFLERVLDMVREKGMETMVRYLGPISIEDVALAIDECDLGIIPNRRSIFTEINTPTRIFEYLSRGKPVIAPRAPGIQDYFNDADLLLFELGDADDLARKLAYAYSHPAGAAETVRRGQGVYLAHRWGQERAKLLDATVACLS
jgi:glycosyltransferase involved in cell wall biosynthesis